MDVKSFGSATMFRTGGTGLGSQIFGKEYKDISGMTTLEDIQGAPVVSTTAQRQIFYPHRPKITPKVRVCSPSS